MPSHLTKEERDRLAQLHHQGFTQAEIAQDLQRSPGTISRELARNRSGAVYLAAQAQDRAQRRRSQRPLQRKMDCREMSETVRLGLRELLISRHSFLAFICEWRMHPFIRQIFKIRR